METKWQKIVNDLTEIVEKCRKQDRNYLIIVDNETKYQAFVGGSPQELSKMIATNMLRRESFEEIIMNAVKTFMNVRNTLKVQDDGK